MRQHLKGLRRVYILLGFLDPSITPDFFLLLIFKYFLIVIIIARGELKVRFGYYSIVEIRSAPLIFLDALFAHHRLSFFLFLFGFFSLWKKNCIIKVEAQVVVFIWDIGCSCFLKYFLFENISK